MPLKIRCPHCLRTLIAEDETAGEGRRCPACGMGFTVPLPAPKAQGQLDIAGRCPSCGGEFAPGTQLCQGCLTDLHTGERMPRAQRWALRARQRWVPLSLLAVVLLVAGFAALQTFQTRQAHVERERREQERLALAAEQAATRQPAPVGAAAANRLLAASDAAARVAAYHELRALGPDALTTLILNWADSPDVVPVEQRTANQVVTARLLEEVLDSGGAVESIVAREAPPLLRRWRQAPAARAAADQVLARWGDSAARANVERDWLDALRRKLFFERAAILAPGPASEHAARRAAADVETLAATLQGLPGEARVQSLQRLLEGYWASWSWLGQPRGDGFLVELFEVAKPPARPELDFKLRIRAARRLLDEVSQESPLSSLAAAGVAIQQVTPQYESLQDRVSERLAQRLSEADTLEQQRAVWTLSALNNVSFGAFTSAKHPSAVGAAEVGAAGMWALRRDPRLAATRVHNSYAAAPQMRRRIVSSQAQLEHALVREFLSGFDAAEAAVDRWLDEGLGFSARLAPICDPGQRAPTLSAIAPTLLVAVARRHQQIRPTLVLWREALDQPAWVRGFASTALAILDARGAATGTERWPADLQSEMFPSSAPGPSWVLWGRLLREADPGLIERLRSAESPLPSELRRRLIAEADAAAKRRPRAQLVGATP